MSRISTKGVLIGGLIDVVSSFLVGLPFAIYAVLKVDLAHTPKDQIAAATTAVLNTHPGIYASQIGMGLACSILGGYISARLAKHDEILNGALSSWLCVLIGIFTITFGKDSHSFAMQALMLVASPAFALGGGYLSSIQTRNRAARK